MKQDGPTILLLSESQRKQIEREALAAYPNECCGIMFGLQTAGERRISLLHAVDNAFEHVERFHRFSISPKDLMAAEESAAEREEMVLGFYHSHPDQSAEPSEIDRTHAWEFYSYVIISVQNAQPGEMKCWQLDEQSQQFRREEISVVRR